MTLHQPNSSQLSKSTQTPAGGVAQHNSAPEARESNPSLSSIRGPKLELDSEARIYALQIAQRQESPNTPENLALRQLCINEYYLRSGSFSLAIQVGAFAGLGAHLVGLIAGPLGYAEVGSICGYVGIALSSAAVGFFLVRFFSKPLAVPSIADDSPTDSLIRGYHELHVCSAPESAVAYFATAAREAKSRYQITRALFGIVQAAETGSDMEQRLRAYRALMEIIVNVALAERFGQPYRDTPLILAIVNLTTKFFDSRYDTIGHDGHKTVTKRACEVLEQMISCAGPQTGAALLGLLTPIDELQRCLGGKVPEVGIVLARVEGRIRAVLPLMPKDLAAQEPMSAA